MSVSRKFERIRALAASGDLESARRLGRSTFKKHPTSIPVGLAYADALLAGGDYRAAADVLARFIRTHEAPVEVFLMHAYASMQLQRPEQALISITVGLETFSNHPELLNYAGVLSDSLNHPASSELYFRKLIDLQPRRGSAFLGLGNALRQQGQNDEALKAYGAAVALEPSDPSPRINRANLMSDMGEHAGAQAAYRDILQRYPERSDVLSNLAGSLASAGDHAAAAKSYAEFLDIHPQDFDARLSWGKALLKSGDAAESVRVLDAMAQTYPQRTEICPELINACLKNGEETRARDYQALYKEKFPTSANVYSCDTILDVTSGVRDVSQDESRYDADIQVAQIAVPDAYGTELAFWDEVCAAVYAHPSLRESPRAHATREGLHSDNLAEEPVAPALQHLIYGIEKQVREYAAQRANAGNPFFDDLSLDGTLFRMWAVVMRQGGHQEAHIHPSARISGVLYAKVPTTIRDGNDRSGWIELGRPHADFFEAENLATRMLQPKLGRIVLFPAYLYHRTLPLDGNDHRISIAFDVCTPD